MGALLGEHLSAGDLLIDLAWNIDCGEIVQWCHDRGVLYINTSVELWDPYAGAEQQAPHRADALLAAHEAAADDRVWKEPGPTAVIEHGANPGLISHFTKHALLDIAEQALADRKFAGAAGRERSRTTPRPRSSTTSRTSWASRSFTAASATRRSPTGPRRSTSSSTPGASRDSAKRAPRRPRWAGARTKKSCRRCAFEHPDGPEEPDLPGAHGHQHLRRELGAAGPPHRRHGRPPRRSVHHHREADRLGERQGRCTVRPSTTRTVRATAPSRRSTSCAAATTSCSRASAS